jgi:hypothetical protein
MAMAEVALGLEAGFFDEFCGAEMGTNLTVANYMPAELGENENRLAQPRTANIKSTGLTQNMGQLLRLL